MRFFSNKNIEKQAKFLQAELQEKKQISSECSKEIEEVLKKYNCTLDIKQQIVIIPK